MVRNNEQGRRCPQGDIWKCLRTLLVVTASRDVLASSEQSLRMGLNILECTGKPLQQRMNSPKYHIFDISNINIKISIVPKWRNLELHQATRGSRLPILILFLAMKPLTIKYAVGMHYLLMMTFLYRSEYKSSHFVCANQ